MKKKSQLFICSPIGGYLSCLSLELFALSWYEQLPIRIIVNT